MTGSECVLLIVAKAPVAGRAKTRLTPALSPDEAAELAAASLLDTLDVARRTPVSTRVVAFTGELAHAHRGTEIAAALADFTVIPQRGAGLPRRLVNAHIDAATIARCPVLQIGMDTPQVTPDLLGAAAATLTAADVDAVFGPATDGGWWALGVSTPNIASVVANIATSRPDTGARTLSALRRYGCRVSELAALTDVDTPDDVWVVAAGLSADSRFRTAALRHWPPT